MKQFFTFLVASLISLAAFSQKTIHDPNAEVREATGFHAIEVSDGIDLYLSNGNEAVAVSAKETDQRSKIRTEVKDGVLKIYYGERNGVHLSFGNRSLKAYVSYKMLDRLSASGGSDVKVEGTIKASSFKLDVSGGSDFEGRIEAGSLQVEQSGGSDVNISGSAGTAKISASGGCDLDGYDLVTDTCTIEASGGSDINITVNGEISAEATGASDVSWKGNAKVKSARASGAGSVSHRSK